MALGGPEGGGVEDGDAKAVWALVKGERGAEGKFEEPTVLRRYSCGVGARRLPALPRRSRLGSDSWGNEGRSLPLLIDSPSRCGASRPLLTSVKEPARLDVELLDTRRAENGTGGASTVGVISDGSDVKSVAIVSPLSATGAAAE